MVMSNNRVLKRDEYKTVSTTLFLLSWLVRMRHSITPGLYSKEVIYYALYILSIHTHLFTWRVKVSPNLFIFFTTHKHILLRFLTILKY